MQKQEDISENDLLDLMENNKQQRINILSRNTWYKISLNVKEIIEDWWLAELPNWIKKQTRKLKQQARKILWDIKLSFLKIYKYMDKISIRFFNDREVRAVWDDENSKWWFSVIDIIAVLTDQDDYEKSRNYWKYLKAKLKKENNKLVSDTT